ncbi:WXG100 family type VII secretion target [Oscillochloris sp. ZM17-4]|uniref:WXG100 family type VII secretion target n=1 Tax=Oscillochloris sp. ZM17-4 TaxID=2866714 RepID=UPI001C737903|nr:WXG100 family type VII secretion target [Oscillochloris sp. ZM17-4]MBX0330386.1 WXG100 family type VII secretion target [Oscillochloris sp. ZM17-4]
MSSDRVLSTGTARQAITRFQSIVNGELLSQINELHSQGQILSDANNWDGQLASQFRSYWSETNGKLRQIQQALEQLRQQVSQINQNIMQAGGNS